MPKLKGVVLCLHPKRNPSETFSVQEMVLDCSYENQEGDVVSKFLMVQASNKNIDKLTNATLNGVVVGVSAGDTVEVDVSMGSSSTFIGKKSGLPECVNNMNLSRITIIEKGNGAPPPPPAADADEPLL